MFMESYFRGRRNKIFENTKTKRSFRAYCNACKLLTLQENPFLFGKNLYQLIIGSYCLLCDPQIYTSDKKNHYIFPLVNIWLKEVKRKEHVF